MDCDVDEQKRRSNLGIFQGKLEVQLRQRMNVSLGQSVVLRFHHRFAPDVAPSTCYPRFWGRVINIPGHLCIASHCIAYCIIDYDLSWSQHKTSRVACLVMLSSSHFSPQKLPSSSSLQPCHPKYSQPCDNRSLKVPIMPKCFANQKATPPTTPKLPKICKASHPLVRMASCHLRRPRGSCIL